MELMKSNNIIIIGAGGFGREVMWLIERINKVSYKWNVLGYVDDDAELQNCVINGYRVLGQIKYLRNYGDEIYVVCAISSPLIRKKIISELSLNNKIKFAVLIDPSVIISNYVTVGEGSVICSGTIVTVNIEIGKHVIINLDCTIGHDVIIDDFVTLYPSVNVSGNVSIKGNVEIGTGTQIIQGIQINEKVVIGAGAVVVKMMTEQGTYVGIPARKKHE